MQNHSLSLNFCSINFVRYYIFGGRVVFCVSNHFGKTAGFHQKMFYIENIDSFNSMRSINFKVFALLLMSYN